MVIFPTPPRLIAVQETNFYWMRQPLQSVERLLTALKHDDLANLFRDECIIEAIEGASPAMGEQLRSGRQSGAEIKETLLKYVLRMSTRCTPFGLFAGGAVGYVAPKSTFDFRQRKVSPHRRLDTEALVDLALTLTSHPAVKENILFHANETAYRIGDRIRYTERSWKNGHWHYFASEVPADPAILHVLDRARGGASVPELAQSIAGDQPLASATEFIRQLIEDGLLMSELMPTPTGSDSFQILIHKLDGRSIPADLPGSLRQIQNLLAQTERAQPLGEIRAILIERFGLDGKVSSVVQTDALIEGGINQLSQAVYDQLRKTLLPLHVLSRFTTEPADLLTFKNRFYARYQEQEVPLLLALDGDTGIGYGQSMGLFGEAEQLIGDLPVPDSTATGPTFHSDELHDLRLRLYTRSLTDGFKPVTITDGDLALLGKGELPLPPSYYAFGSFLAASAAAIDQGEFQFLLKALSGPSGFTLMGRFCAIDAQLAQLVGRHMARQQARQPELIYAEIAHLPQPRTGNVVRRPHLCPYEIPYLTHSELPPEQQLHLDDLLVSVPGGGRVVLRSKRLGKEVIPQLTTAHDYRSGLPIYHFLCALQAQQTPFAVQWHWGAFTKARRLPRVLYRSIVLQEASWQFSMADLSPALSAEQNVALLRESNHMPRLVALTQGDQELFIDLDSGVCCELVVSTLKRLGNIRVIEWLRTPDQCPVEGPDGRLTHEVVVPFMNFEKASPSGVIHNRPPVTVPRTFAPGSEWLYLKVYGGLSSMPAILTELCGWAANAELRKEATHWFFVRYADPEPHLRFRIRVKKAGLHVGLLAECHRVLNPFLISGEVHSIQLDTYQRELERYGQELMEETELIFWRDSEATNRLLQLSLGEPGMLPFACRSVEAYLSAFGLTLAQKAAFCQSAYEQFSKEHGATKAVRQSLSQKYRVNRPSVEQALRSPVSAMEREADQVIRLRTLSMAAELDTVRDYYQTNSVEKAGEYLGSIIHMSINRLFAASQRTYELLIYHHLYRAYQSAVARHAG